MNSQKTPSKELRAILLGIATLKDKTQIERALNLLDYPALCQVQDLSGRAAIPGFAAWIMSKEFDVVKAELEPLQSRQ